METEYDISATVTNDESRIQRVPCRVSIPRKDTDPLAVHIFLSRRQLKILEPLGCLTLSGQEPGTFVIGLAKVEAAGVFVQSIERDQRHNEWIVSAHARSLLVQNRFSQKRTAVGKSNGCFWLTRVRHLTPVPLYAFPDSGDIEIRHKRQIVSRLPNGMRIMFDHQRREHVNKQGDTVISSQLVGEFAFEATRSPVSKMKEALTHLDDFLLITSFAARQRCVCTGWEFQNNAAHVRYFRRDIAIPVRQRTAHENWLLLLRFEEFAKLAFGTFTRLESAAKQHLRRAINLTLPLPKENRSIESSFIALFAALETLVLGFRRTKGHEYIVLGEEWISLKRELKEWLVARSPEEGRRLSENLEGLRRVPLGRAFNRFRSEHNLKLDDLWPVVGDGHGPSLTDIRNRIVHGETFVAANYPPIVIATDHLRWTVERMILSMLGWDIEMSEVSKPNLAKEVTRDAQWKEHRRALFIQRMK